MDTILISLPVILNEVKDLGSEILRSSYGLPQDDKKG
jgi:hypothetical protein